MPFILCFLMGAFGAACSDDNPDNTPDNPDTPSQSITIPAGEDTAPVLEQAGGTATLTFTATDDWTAEVTAVTRAADWVSVQPTGGRAGENTLTITTQPNDTYDERNAAITLTCAGQQTTLTVTQKQQDALLVSSNKVELDAEGGSFSLTVQANVSVSHTIEEGASWLTTASTRALTESTLSFEAAANEDTEPRQVTITLTGGGLTEQVTVYQAGTDPTLVLGQREYLVGSAGETIQVELRSNTDYEVRMSGVDWLAEASTRALSAYTHYFTIAPNDTYDSRTAQIVFTSKAEGIADTLTVTQLQLDAIVLAQSEYTVLSAEDTLSFPVQANVEVTASTDVDWITQLPTTRALQEQELSFRIDALPDTIDRQGTITLTGGGATQQITVKQIHAEPKLVRVEYRTGYEWNEAEYNLPLRYNAIVYRDRYYENGEVITDTFMDVAHLASGALSPSPEFVWTEDLGFGHQIERIAVPRELVGNDSTSIQSVVDIVPSLNALVINPPEFSNHVWFTDYVGQWDKYIVSKLYDPNEFIDASGVPSDVNWPEDGREPGWYFSDIQSLGRHTIDYIGPDGFTHKAYYRYDYGILTFDQYLVIDGRRIDFSDYWPTEENNITYDVTVEDIAGPAKVTKHKFNFTYLGRNFSSIVIDTFYEQKYEPAEIYYFKGGESYYNVTPEDGDYSNFKLGSPMDGGPGENIILEASERPLTRTDSDWIIIDGIDEGSRSSTSPMQLNVREWTIRWHVLPNEGEGRQGHIYFTNKKGEVMRTALIDQGLGFGE